LVKKTDKACKKCGAALVERLGKFGKFYACSKFPECKYTESIENGNKNLNIKCPVCKIGDIVIKKTRRGKIFYGCNTFPKCDFALWDKPINEFCPKCDSILIEKRKKIVCSNKNCGHEQQSTEDNLASDAKKF
jgi:DNA topoisomerase-1